MLKALENAGFEVLYSNRFFNEFVVKLDQDIKNVNNQLNDRGFIGGFDLGKVDESFKNHMLVAVTEIRSKEEIDQFVKELGDIHG